MAVNIAAVPGAVCAPRGFSVGTAMAGIRQAPRDDLLLLVSETPCTVGATFTTNLLSAWCVQHNRARVNGTPHLHGIVVNAGNANCSNGEQGREADRRFVAVAETRLATLIPALKVPRLLSASTGVIGRHFPIEKAEAALAHLALHRDGERAARAIMTTDTRPKATARRITTSQQEFFIGGIAKGAGMIAPNMATMLGFITTDIALDAAVLQPIVSRVVARTFNRITVDGDTSTNDMVVVFANGSSGVLGKAGSEEIEAFELALNEVCTELAKAIARDGEGATKLVTITLRHPPAGGEQIAMTIANSPLVKTACHGNDPNWGRIVAAAGRAGVSFDPRRVVVTLAGHEVFRDGEPTSFDPGVVSAAMRVEELPITLDFLDEKVAGRESITVWTCDFTEEYIRVNADYTT